jgi:dihydroorotate dehydrogenase
MDLSTNYLGMKLRTPLVASASPLSRNVDDVKGLEEAGAAAVVFHSVFEEQLQSSPKAADFRVDPDALELNIYTIPADMDALSKSFLGSRTAGKQVSHESQD